MNSRTITSLFDALRDLEDTLCTAHPDLPLDEHAQPQDTAILLADAVLFLIDNLRAATSRYQRQAHLARYFPRAPPQFDSHDEEDPDDPIPG